MSNIEFKQQIDWALENIQMSLEMRDFLTNLKNNIPETEAGRMQVVTEWMELLFVSLQVAGELYKYT